MTTDPRVAAAGIESRQTPTRGPVGESSAEGEPSLDGVFAADGVDLTVIRWMLDRSPEERLQAAQELIDLVSAVRGDDD